jgi:hypothetical protein
MKNQYFGDVNDFRKYGLLRALRRASGLTVGVCWCLTNDEGGHGELRRYLSQPGRWRHHDPELYEQLQRLLTPEVRRSVSLAREWGLVPEASYFEKLLSDNRANRVAYFEEARQALASCDVIFVDPDNGIEVSSSRTGTVGSSKYVYWPELKTLFDSGQSLLVYQHFPRVARDRFVPSLMRRLAEEFQGASIGAFSTAHVAFFLAQQARHAGVFENTERTMQSDWSGQFKAWPNLLTVRRLSRSAARRTFRGTV